MRSARVELILDTLKAVRGAKDLSAATDDLADNLGETARQGDKAGRAIDDAGDEMSQSARAAAALDHEIDKLSGSMRELAISQALTGRNFGKQIREQETAVRRLGKNRKLLGDAGDDAALGFAARFSKRIGPLMANAPLSPGLLAAAGGAAVAVGPLIGAAISGAVIGGAGIGGVIGGLVVASKDARVQAAADSMGARIESRLKFAAGSFVGPAIDGLQQIETALNSINIERIFAQSSKFVGPLAAGASAAITDIGNAIEKLVANAGPVINVIGDGIAKIGSSLANGLNSLSDNGDEAAAAMRDLFGIISLGITSTLQLVNGLTELYGISHKLGFDTGLQLVLKLTGSALDDTADSAHKTADGLRKVGSGTFGAAGGIQEVAGAAGASVFSLQAMADRLDRVTTASRTLFDASTSVGQAIHNVSEAVKANGRTLDSHTEKGRANRAAISSLATALNTQYQATLAVNGVGAKTDAVAARNRASFIRLATSMTGSKKEAIALANKLLGIPVKHDTKIGTPGLPQADAGIKNYGKKLDKLTRKITTSVTVVGDRAAYGKLAKLLVQQQALKKGIPISAARSAFDKNSANAFYSGGYTGPGSKYQPAGIVHAGEYVFSAKATSKLGVNRLDRMHNSAKAAPGYATGGLVAPFRVTAAMTRIPSLAEALAAVIPAFGNWPSSPGAQRGDSGVWRRVVALINSTGPMSGQFGNAYRPGDPLWHGSGRAVDWMGYNQGRLATFLAGKRPLELIHRTDQRDYAYTRGRNKGSFNNSLMEAHRNHIHIAMANGGMIREPVVGVGRSGRTYSFAENGRPERVLSAAQTASGGGGGNTYVLHATFSGPVGSRQELDNWLAGSIDRLKGKGRA